MENIYLVKKLTPRTMAGFNLTSLSSWEGEKYVSFLLSVISSNFVVARPAVPGL
jgi:hypothetical protein